MIKLRKPFAILALATVVVSSLVFTATAYGASTVNLIFHWNLNEGSGTTALDDSGNSYDGTLYNGATYVAGNEGTGVELNGVDQYIQTPAPFGFLGTPDQPYALSAWVKIAQPNSSGNIFHISSEMDGSGWCIPFLTLTSGHLAATGWDNNGQVSANDPAVATIGEWHQVISTWDVDNGLRLFVDGALVSTTPQSEYSASGSPMYASLGLGAGSCSNDQGFFNGVVDDARIYSRALLPEDVEAIASEGSPAVVDPGTPAVSNPANPGVPNTGLKQLPIWTILLASVVGLTILVVSLLYIRNLASTRAR